MDRCAFCVVSRLNATYVLTSSANRLENIFALQLLRDRTLLISFIGNRLFNTSAPHVGLHSRWSYEAPVFTFLLIFCPVNLVYVLRCSPTAYIQFITEIFPLPLISFFPLNSIRDPIF